MTRESSIDYSHGLALTISNSSSLRSYNSSIAESTATQKSIGSRVKRALSRKRSKSLVSTTSSNSSSGSESRQMTTSSTAPTSPAATITPSSVAPSASASTATTIKHKITRNKSMNSMLTSLYSLSTAPSSQSSTRDNSISSLSDYELDFATQPISPLHRIEEDTTEVDKSKDLLQSIRYNPAKRQGSLANEKEVKVCDEVLDTMADNILNQVGKESPIVWRI